MAASAAESSMRRQSCSSGSVAHEIVGGPPGPFGTCGGTSKYKRGAARNAIAAAKDLKIAQLTTALADLLERQESPGDGGTLRQRSQPLPEDPDDRAGCKFDSLEDTESHDELQEAIVNLGSRLTAMEQLHIDMRLLLLERCVDTTTGKIYGPQAEYDNTNIQYSNSNIISKISHEQYVQQAPPETLIDTHVNKILGQIQKMWPPLGPFDASTSSGAHASEHDLPHVAESPTHFQNNVHKVCHEHHAPQVPPVLLIQHAQQVPYVLPIDTTVNEIISEQKSANDEDFHDQVIDTPVRDDPHAQGTTDTEQMRHPLGPFDASTSSGAHASEHGLPHTSQNLNTFFTKKYMKSFTINMMNKFLKQMYTEIYMKSATINMMNKYLPICLLTRL